MNVAAEAMYNTYMHPPNIQDANKKLFPLPTFSIFIRRARVDSSSLLSDVFFFRFFSLLLTTTEVTPGEASSSTDLLLFSILSVGSRLDD